ncbi:hypothetical protein I3843_05G069000 [Carya illinoinensis]|nr:hypothetical protein I3843_05G069000 [Carya illinoinensis]
MNFRRSSFMSILIPSLSQLHPFQAERSEAKLQDCTSTRKTQKAGREKLRRDRLNKQFVALGNGLDG